MDSMTPMPTPHIDTEARQEAERMNSSWDVPSARFGEHHAVRDLPEKIVRRSESYVPGAFGVEQARGHLALGASGIENPSLKPVARLETL